MNAAPPPPPPAPPPPPVPAPSPRLRLDAPAVEAVGTLVAAVNPVLRARLPEARIGELCAVDRGTDAPPLHAEVIGLAADHAVLMPLGPLTGIPMSAPVRPLGRPLTVPTGDALRGRVVNGIGQPIDGRGDIAGAHRRLDAPPPPALSRPPIDRPLVTGVRAIDGLLTLGVGQRVGVFAGAGTGKSTLLGQLARGAGADRVVVAMIGERGREVAEFMADALGPEGRERAAVVVSTSDEPALLRLKAAQTACTLAEAWRDEGHNVLLLMDSLTRYARALREVGLAAGEPPGRQGYPAGVFAELPRLLERAGRTSTGSITGIYTVLAAGDDLTEPVADEAMGLLDGHLVLSRELAQRQQYPAIDVLQSKSRVMHRLDRTCLPTQHHELAGRCLEAVASYEANRKLIAVGRFDTADDAERARTEAGPRIWSALRQGNVNDTLAETHARLQAAAPPPDSPAPGPTP